MHPFTANSFGTHPFKFIKVGENQFTNERQVVISDARGFRSSVGFAKMRRIISKAICQDTMDGIFQLIRREMSFFDEKKIKEDDQAVLDIANIWFRKNLPALLDLQHISGRSYAGEWQQMKTTYEKLEMFSRSVQALERDRQAKRDRALVLSVV